MKLLLATANKHKLREIRSIFQSADLEFATPEDFDSLPEVVEDRDTFEGNAVKKACELAAASGLTAMADDSGLEVDALGGAPGVYSARYSGVHGDDRANNAKLLMEMTGIEERTARFRCVIALAQPTGEVDTVAGVCNGVIAHAATGENGFGYDPVFIPAGYEQTFAELGPEIKNSISHRARALQEACRKWFQPQAGPR
jgi:XTP/dITP diphosphohydrolase